MVGLVLLYLAMGKVCQPKSGSRVALFSDNQPNVHWVQRMASKTLLLAGQLVHALRMDGITPLTPLHVAGKKNAMTDVTSCSFGSEPKWLCKSDAELLSLYNKLFPLPNQQSWTVFLLSSAIFFESSFRSADEGYFNGRVAATFKNREVHWALVAVSTAKLQIGLRISGLLHKGMQ